MLFFSLIKRKVALFLVIIILININAIFSYIKIFLFLIINKLDALILDHRIFYYSVILSINILLIINAYIRYKINKKREKE
ncbi:hypothetical protein D7256_03705 [Legionella pneumophila]|uniref:Uncharacterized protein n=1 Tax=Legionella maceachernii TaxID=466 RepID=A0A0W0VYG5_9GAMM|nr:hypothetical protein Lmac_2265 [Legionella maceachernii]RYV55899.1 hypothetical protein D7261_08760 [Legionella pneumophila]RYV67231.1 hypothetical protein D7251_07450 [Legionella pneumophila]RYW19175.1 hypothetical protein D7246_00825 [Legionella pneumophila]RYW59144.1 hypothetical protein D7256_03705 [Legionella pneumophila]